MRFCGQCGAALGRAAEPERRVPRAPVGERRLLTVMFCDLVGSTRLASMIEPEDLRDVLLAFREACAGAIEHFGGTIGSYLGDGILAYFGYPRARENDVQRALRAALRAQASIEAVRSDLARSGLEMPMPLAVRIGIHSGLVVVADLGKGRNAEAAAVVGETPNIAARLQAAAASGSILMSEATARLAGDRFELSDAGPRDLAGLPQPIHAYELLAERPNGAPVASSVLPHFAVPFFNRHEPRDQMRRAWNAAKRGRGGCVAIAAEPGMGKTRLVWEFRSSIGRAGHAAMILTCFPEDRSSSYHPLLTWLRAELTEPGADLRDALGRALAPSGEARHERQLAALLDCATQAELRDLAQSPRRRRRETVDAFLALVEARVLARSPYLVVVEDLHWADESTLAVVRALAERCRAGQGGYNVLLVVTMRARNAVRLDFASSVIELERLPDADAKDLVRAMVPTGAADELVNTIVQRTDGIPLFAEEVSRLAALADSAAAGRGGPGAIPLTLRSALTAQLDGLGKAKSIAQLASAFGRSFQHDILEASVEERERALLAPALERLVESRLIEKQEVPAGAQLYSFRHALIRDAAYDSIVRERRRAMHGRIGQTLRTSFRATPYGRPELLAQHFALAGMAIDAAEQFEEAATRAVARSTHTEAAEHCRAGLEQLTKAPDGLHAAELEIRLQILLAAQITVLRGNADPAVRVAFERARQVAEAAQHDQWLRRALRGLHTYHLVRGEIGVGLRISERVMELAQGDVDAGHRIQVHRPHGLTLLYMGDFVAARRELEAAIALYDRDAHATHRFEYGSDPFVLAQAHLGWVEWFLGDSERASKASQAAIAAARTLDHPHSVSFALAFQACLSEFMDEPDAARFWSEELIRVATHHDYAYWSAWGLIVLGWAQAKSGGVEAGEILLRRGLAEYEATGAGLLAPYANLLLADIVRPHQRRRSDRLRTAAATQADRGGMGIWAAWLARRAD